MTLAISIGIFLFIIMLGEGVYYFYHQHLNPTNRTLKRRLRGGSGKPKDLQSGDEAKGILRQRKLSDLPWLNSLLTSMTNLGGVEKLLQQSNSQLPLGGFFLLSAVLAVCGMLIAGIVDYPLSVGLGFGAMGCFLPLMWFKIQRKRRFKKFEQQLPESLDLMARALRAGHAFSVGMKME